MSTEINTDFVSPKAISPVEEISAYETLWTRYSTPKRIGELFELYRHALPREVASEIAIEEGDIEKVKTALAKLFPFSRYTALFHLDPQFPVSLKELSHGPEVIYYQGALDLLFSRCISIVGARKTSDEGIKRARKLSKLLVQAGYTIMSGLAEGIDTAAHKAALEEEGRTIGVIGTPLSQAYPRDNESLQSEIASKHLLISQVPFYQTSLQGYRINRLFFPERNKTMAALSIATVIVEASDTSGSLYQAKAAIELGRKLFILNSCFERGLKWPKQFLDKGAIRIVDGSEILDALNKAVSPSVQ